jgi:phosphomannomutase
VAIRFGTDGWRGVIADDFTFDGVRAVSQAVADLIHEEGRSGSPVPVGHDVRFLSRRFAEAAAGVLEGNGIPTMLPDAPTTTPMVSCQVVAAAAPVGVCITASHNPPQYNGVKIKAAFGGSAPPELTARLEALLGRRAPRHGRPPERRHPFLPAYVPRLHAVADLEAIRRSPLRVVVDSMHGAGGRILEGLLRGRKTRVVTLHGEPDVLFGGIPPEPRPENLTALAEAVVRSRAHIGIATDGDADRFGIIDRDGTWVSPNHILALVYDYLVDTRGWNLPAARSVATSQLVDAAARARGQSTYQTPVGFKYIGQLIREDKIALRNRNGTRWIHSKGTQPRITTKQNILVPSPCPRGGLGSGGAVAIGLPKPS